MHALMKKFLFNAFLLLPLMVFLLLLEIGFRVHAYVSDNRLQQGLENLGVRSDAGDLSLQHIIRWHDDPRIIYELIPGLYGEFRGHPLTINSYGFRGPALSLDKPSNAYRIIGLGDSVMFGWGVGDEDFYLYRLGELLQATHPDRRIEWINSAVPGYNTVNEVETRKRKLLGFEPDLVIVDYVGNDLFVPGFIRSRQPYFTFDYSFLARFVQHRLNGLHVPDNTLQRPPDAFRHASFLGEESLIPPAYRDLIGIDAFRAAIEELGRLSRMQGFRVLFFAHHGFDPEPLAAVQSAGFEVLDAGPMAEAFLRQRGLIDYQGSPLTVSAKDSHPSALYHRMLAELLARHIDAYLETAPP